MAVDLGYVVLEGNSFADVNSFEKYDKNDGSRIIVWQINDPKLGLSWKRAVRESEYVILVAVYGSLKDALEA